MSWTDRDYAEVAKRLRELRGESADQLLNEVCLCGGPPCQVSGFVCGRMSCPECGGGGWVQVYSPRPPAFEECQMCYNILKLPCP